MSNKLDWPRYTRWTWIIALLALIALVWMWMSGRGPNSGNCCGAPSAAVVAAPAAAVAAATAPVAAPAVAQAITQAITASWSGKTFTLEGVVGDAATKKAMLDAAIAKYGAANVVDKITVDAAAKGDVTITLTGEVASDAAKSARGAEVQAFYPSAKIDNQLSVVQAAAPTVASTAAEVQCGDKIAVTANFATGSAKLSPGMAKLLGAVVPCIKGPYEVGGHTDNVGADAANQALSERRAKAVAGFLASKGVDAKLLSSKGYGESAPTADNATAEGRTKNRRIEFKKM